jgi:hypothetical protein
MRRARFFGQCLLCRVSGHFANHEGCYEPLPPKQWCSRQSSESQTRDGTWGKTKHFMKYRDARRLSPEEQRLPESYKRLAIDRLSIGLEQPVAIKKATAVG